jgi:hypothetical protein
MARNNPRVSMSNRYRRYPRVRVPTPFPCSLARIEGRTWFNRHDPEVGVVNDVSLRGVRVTTEAEVKPGDRVSLSLRLPNQTAPADIAVATVRWTKDQICGLAFQRLSQSAHGRLRKYMVITARAVSKAGDA